MLHSYLLFNVIFLLVLMAKKVRKYYVSVISRVYKEKILQ